MIRYLCRYSLAIKWLFWEERRILEQWEPDIPQRWKDDLYIYYFNHQDNGEQSIDEMGMSRDGERYQAEFTIVQSLEDAEIERAITRSIIDPELERAVVENIEVDKGNAIEVKKEYLIDDITAIRINSLITKISDLKLRTL